tara:strand:- start:90 stop:542 length:453 start_codon:yes stop_codon:yes gene_type:complete
MKKDIIDKLIEREQQSFWNKFKVFVDNSGKSVYNIFNINAIKNGSKTMAQAKNYTDEMVSEMTKRYTESPTRETVDALAQDMGKTVRSIIAKLSREGVYVAQPRTTKSGEPVISKSELVAQINEHFGIELPTLVKAGKQDLQKLVEVLNS